MTDIAQVKQNIAKMISLNAPEEDIDGYIASEGYSLDDIRNYGKPQIKALSEEQKAKPQPTNKLDIAIEALKGFGQGVVGGTERALNTATFGGYDWLNRKAFNDAYGKRQEALQAQAENAGVGGLNTVANLLTDIGAGGATSGELALAGAGKLGLKGLGKLIGAGAIESGAYGLTGSDTLDEAMVNVPASATTGAIISGGLGSAGGALKRFIPSLEVVGKKSGITNALDDSSTYKALKRGAVADEDIAKQLSVKIPTEQTRINEETAETLERLTGKRVDLEGARQANKQAYKELFDDLGWMEILNKHNQKGDINNENFRKFIGNSSLIDESGKPLTMYHNSPYKGIKSFDTAKSKRGKGVWFAKDAEFASDYGYNKYPSYVRAEKSLDLADSSKMAELLEEYNQTKSNLSGILESQKFTKYNEPFASKVINSLDDENFIKFLKNKGYDSVTKSNIGTYMVFDPDQIKSVYNSGKWAKGSNLYDDLTLAEKVNPETKFQKGVLAKAIAKADTMTNEKMGSLAHTNEVKKALNTMADSSMIQGSGMQMKVTPETAQILELKSKLDDILRQNSEVKRLDAEYANIAKQQEAYEQGYKASTKNRFKPSNEAEKIAYNKGVVDNLLSDVRADKNLARDVLNKQNVLKNNIDAEKYSDLMKVLSSQSGKHSKASSLGKLSEKTLDKYSNSLPFWREIIESQGSKVGATLDVLQRSLYGNADKRVAQRILNGMPIKEKSALLEVLARTNPTVTGEYINENFMGR